MTSDELLELAQTHFKTAEDLLVELARIPSVTPPSDTRLISRFVFDRLKSLSGVTCEIVSEVQPIDNVVAIVRGYAPGKRLLLNGHLDTFEVVEPENWQHKPFGGEVENRRLFGTGVSDMKAGCASLITTFELLAEHRDMWKGEVVLTLVGGEECGGMHGTGYLLRTRPELKADACLIADVGSPRVIRFGEKGRYRFELKAKGIPGHGAHTHKTRNANELLIDAISDFRAEVRKLKADAPAPVTAAILAAAPVSESIAGKGETETLLNPTINIGILNGGTAPNLVPGYAEAVIDTRIPAGIASCEIEQILEDVCNRHPGLSFVKQMAFEPLYSDPDHPFLKILCRNSFLSFGLPSAATMRVGGTDAKHVRQYSIPTYVCGVEGGKMGAPDEYADFDELDHLLEIHVLSVFEYLQ